MRTQRQLWERKCRSAREEGRRNPSQPHERQSPREGKTQEGIGRRTLLTRRRWWRTLGEMKALKAK